MMEDFSNSLCDVCVLSIPFMFRCFFVCVQTNALGVGVSGVWSVNRNCILIIRILKLYFKILLINGLRII